MQLALAAAGSYIGGMMAGGAGVVAFGMTGAQLGFMAGSMLGGVLFQPKLPDGPRMNDLSIQTSTYGASIPRVWGSARIAGNVIWTTDLVEHAHEEGGKGSPSYTTYTYTVSFAVSLCEGPISGVRRIWADGKLIYDISEGSINQIGFTASGYCLYLGTETQQVDPTIQAYMTNTPAYRGQAYWVFADLDLTKYGNRIPNLTFEVFTGTVDTEIPPSRWIGNGTGVSAFGAGDEIWVSDGGHTLYVTDVIAEEQRAAIYIPDDYFCFSVAYNALSNEIMAAPDRPSGLTGPTLITFDPATYTLSNSYKTENSVFVWMGTLGYIPSTHKVWIAANNGIYGDYARILNGSTYASEGVFSVADWTVSIVNLGNTGLVAVQSWSSPIRIFNASTQALMGTFTTDYGSSGCALAFDPEHNQIWAYNVYSEGWGHCYIIDMATLSIRRIEYSANAHLSAVVYHSGINKFIGVQNYLYALHQNPTLHFFDPVTFEMTSFQVVGLDSPMIHDLYEVSGHNDYVVGVGGGVFKLFFASQQVAELVPIPLSQIVTDLSLSCGLIANDINVTELTDLVWGFPLARQGSARSALEYLMMAFLFDAVESEGKVKFVKRGAAPLLTIDADDLAVHEQGQDVPASLEMTRADEIELPRNVTLKYINFEADYQTSAQNAMRQSGRALGELAMDIPVVMIDTHAKAVADYALYSAWAARTTAKWATSLKFAKAEPTDVVRVADNLMRITKRSLQGNILSFEGAMESGIVVASAALAGEANSVTQTIVVYGETLLMLLDVSMLRDEDDDAGFYLAASGFIEAWPGCVLLKSTDNGASYNQMQTLVTPAVIGTAGGVLGDFQDNTFDEFNTVDVTLYSGELVSTTELLVLNGGNAAVLGNEVIQFKNATLVSGTTYVLSGLLRARKGSPTGGHVAGERFVLLNPVSLRRMPPNAAEIGLARIYRAITLGATFSSGTDVAFTNTAQGLECLSPVQLGGGRDASGNLTLTWVRRTRLGGEWRDLVDASLGEVSENYSVDICSDVTYATVVRTLTSTTPTVNYSAFDQATDFGSAQAMVYAVVYQISASMSRGAPLQGVI